MALPESPNTAYNPGDEVKVSDLNDMQTQIVAIAGAKDFAVSVRQFTIIGGAPTWDNVNQLILPIGGAVEIELPTRQGGKLRGIKVRHVDGGGGVITAQVFKRESLAGSAIVTNTAVSAAAPLPTRATWDTDAVTTTVVQPSNPDREFYVQLTAATAICQVHRLLVTMSDH